MASASSNEEASSFAILCLHGYHQNKDTFRQKIGSFRKPFKKYVDFEFLDAPHLLREKNPQEGSLDSAYLQKASSETYAADGRGWWLKNSPEGESDGFQESLDLFEKTLDNGPFDGIMGFSQGAAFLALACILLREKIYSSTITFVIFAAGFKSSLPAHEALYKVDIEVNIPSLHVIGESDEIIHPSRSRELVQLFVNSQVATHPGGHYVPMTKELRDVYKQFIEQFVNK